MATGERQLRGRCVGSHVLLALVWAIRSGANSPSDNSTTSNYTCSTRREEISFVGSDLRELAAVVEEDTSERCEGIFPLPASSLDPARATLRVASADFIYEKWEDAAFAKLSSGESAYKTLLDEAYKDSFVLVAKVGWGVVALVITLLVWLGCCCSACYYDTRWCCRWCCRRCCQKQKEHPNEVYVRGESRLSSLSKRLPKHVCVVTFLRYASLLALFLVAVGMMITSAYMLTLVPGTMQQGISRTWCYVTDCANKALNADNAKVVVKSNFGGAIKILELLGNLSNHLNCNSPFVARLELALDDMAGLDRALGAFFSVLRALKLKYVLIERQLQSNSSNSSNSSYSSAGDRRLFSSSATTNPRIVANLLRAGDSEATLGDLMRMQGDSGHTTGMLEKAAKVLQSDPGALKAASDAELGNSSTNVAQDVAEGIINTSRPTNSMGPVSIMISDALNKHPEEEKKAEELRKYTTPLTTPGNPMSCIVCNSVTPHFDGAIEVVNDSVAGALWQGKRSLMHQLLGVGGAKLQHMLDDATKPVGTVTREVRTNELSDFFLSRGGGGDRNVELVQVAQYFGSLGLFLLVLVTAVIGLISGICVFFDFEGFVKSTNPDCSAASDVATAGSLSSSTADDASAPVASGKGKNAAAAARVKVQKWRRRCHKAVGWVAFCDRGCACSVVCFAFLLGALMRVLGFVFGNVCLKLDGVTGSELNQTWTVFVGSALTWEVDLWDTCMSPNGTGRILTVVAHDLCPVDAATGLRPANCTHANESRVLEHPEDAMEEMVAFTTEAFGKVGGKKMPTVAGNEQFEELVAITQVPPSALTMPDLHVIPHDKRFGALFLLGVNTTDVFVFSGVHCIDVLLPESLLATFRKEYAKKLPPLFHPGFLETGVVPGMRRQVRSFVALMNERGMVLPAKITDPQVCGERIPACVEPTGFQIIKDNATCQKALGFASEPGAVCNSCAALRSLLLEKVALANQQMSLPSAVENCSSATFEPSVRVETPAYANETGRIKQTLAWEADCVVQTDDGGVLSPFEDDSQRYALVFQNSTRAFAEEDNFTVGNISSNNSTYFTNLNADSADEDATAHARVLYNAARRVDMEAALVKPHFLNDTQEFIAAALLKPIMNELLPQADCRFLQDLYNGVLDGFCFEWAAGMARAANCFLAIGVLGWCHLLSLWVLRHCCAVHADVALTEDAVAEDKGEADEGAVVNEDRSHTEVVVDDPRVVAEAETPDDTSQEFKRRAL